MPIKGLSDQLRMPRLGKIHLGVKKLTAKGAEYPSATDYFVCPPEVKAVFGDEPQSLPIYIPTEDAEYWASQYYRAYSQTRGLICKGDGIAYQRMIDTSTKEIAGKDAKNVAWVDGTCPGRDCPIYKETRRGFPQCREMMCLQFMLPDVPGVGVWQIDTGSINSIRNINSEAALIRQICGRINMIPLNLTLEAGETNNPETGKKQTHYFLHLRERSTLHALLDDSRKPLYELLAPPVADLEEAARDIEELWPEDKPAKTTTITFSKPEQAQPEQGAVTAEGQAQKVSPDFLVWVRETLGELNWKYAEVVGWLATKEIFVGLDLRGKLSEVIGRMSTEQAKVLQSEIEDRLKMV